jgi:hypothetical protein
MSVVLLDGNRFVECESILAYKGAPVLRVRFEPLRVELTTPERVPAHRRVRVDESGGEPKIMVRIVRTAESFAVFWQDHALVLATLLEPGTAHLKLDLRPLGMVIYDDVDGLHIGRNVFAGNVVSHSAAAINLGD